MVNISRILKLIKSGIVIGELLLKCGRHLSKPPPYFCLGINDWEESDQDEINALLLKEAELADGELTGGSSDDEIDKILLKASRQFDPVSPPSVKRPKVDSTGSDRFSAQ